MAGFKKMEKARKTMIYLDEVMHDEIKRRAEAGKISMADFIRGAVARELGESRVRALRARATTMRKAGVK